MKKKVSRVVNANINKDDFKPLGELPTAESVESFAASLSKESNIVNRIKTETNKLQLATAETKSYGRPKKVQTVGREPFTTSLNSDLIKQLKKLAAERKKTSVADIIETALYQYFKSENI